MHVVRRELRDELVACLIGLVLPLAVALSWVPVRTRLPNVDLALVLVVLVAPLGALGHRLAVLAAALSSALWFEFFDTAPFEHLGIARNPDIETTVVLALAALIVGELAVRVRRQRLFARAGQEDLATVRSVASLVASGEELVRIIEEVVSDLKDLLDLAECWFESTPSSPKRSEVRGDGSIRPAPRPAGTLVELELPVDVQGERIGHFVLRPRGSEVPERGKLTVALTLAAALGGAFLAQAPPPLPPERAPALPLRLLGAPETAPALGKSERGGPEDQETSGFSCAAVAGSNRS
jgi:hypothetical protein